MNTESRRAYPRFDINKSVTITADNYCTKHLITKNCSEGGIFIKDDKLAEMQVGSKVFIQKDNAQDDPPIESRIAWTNSEGAGLEYLSE